MNAFFEFVRSLKNFFIALVVLVVTVTAYNVYNDVSERLSCVFSDCKKDMAATITRQEGEIAFLRTQLKASEDALALMKANKDDNAQALKEFCQESREISDRADSVIEKAKQASKAQQTKPTVQVVVKPKPETLLVKKETIVAGVEVVHEPQHQVVSIPIFTPEAIIHGLWEMHCGGKHNVCKKDS